MKLIFKSSESKTYFIRVPNYFDHSGIPDLLTQIRTQLPSREKVCEDTIYLQGDDWLTDDEHKQLDTDGKIVRPMVELKM